MLSGLGCVVRFHRVPAFRLRVGHTSHRGLLTAAGAAHAIGVDVRAELLPAPGTTLFSYGRHRIGDPALPATAYRSLPPPVG